MIFDLKSIDHLKTMGINAHQFNEQIAGKFGNQSAIFQSLVEKFWRESFDQLDNSAFNNFCSSTGLPTEGRIYNSSYDFYNYLRLFKSSGKLGLYKHRQAEWDGPVVRLSRSDCPHPSLDLLSGKNEIYRGMSIAEFDSKNFGQSWTTDVQVAMRFATCTYENQQDGIVSVTNLELSSVIHVFENDPESEVVIASDQIASANRYQA